MAGMGTRDIKRKIKSVNNTKQITKAMELVSTAKLKKNKDRMDVTKPYFETVIETVQGIIDNEKSLRNEYINKRDVKKTLYIVITADRGLCGGYNINAIKKAYADMSDINKVAAITIGKRAKSIFNKDGIETFKSFEGISEKPQFSDAQEIAKLALKHYKSEEVDEIKLVYSRLISTISQEPTIIKLLPIEASEKQEINDDQDKEVFEFINYEPSPEAVLSYVIPKYIDSTIFGALVESSASEQAARRVAMESATDNATDLIDELTVTYNQARQSAITQEISEIVNGAEALK